MMAAKKIFLVPTDYPAEAYLAFGPPNLTPEQRTQRLTSTSAFARNNAARLMRAVKAGVRIAFGSDEYYQFPGKTRGESSHYTLEAYQAAGLTPLQVIQAATVNSAELLGLQAGIGSIENGKLADIIAVEGDPLVDVKALNGIRFVMKGGSVIKHSQR
jgi:imidazolonepropionase-like amidohydrolase